MAQLQSVGGIFGLLALCWALSENRWAVSLRDTLIGLAVMGQNLALNIADHGFQISVYNRTTEKTEKFVAENPNTPGGLVGAKTLEEFVASLAKPRKMIILVQAGKATDAVIDGAQSVVYDEAENRLHAQKAVMALTMS